MRALNGRELSSEVVVLLNYLSLKPPIVSYHALLNGHVCVPKGGDR